MEVESAADMQVFRQRFQYAAHHTRANPLLEATMTGLVGRIAFGQVGPRSTRAQDIQDTVQHISARTPRSAATILTPYRFGNQRIEDRPLGVGEVSGGGHLTQTLSLKNVLDL